MSTTTDGIELKLALTGLTAVDAGLTRVTTLLEQNKKAVGEFNKAVGASIGLVTGFSTIAGALGNETLKELAASTDRVALAFANLRNAAQLVTSIRMGAWGAAAGTAIVALGQTVDLIEMWKKETAAKEGLAGVNRKLADSIMDVTAAQQAQGIITEEQAQKFLTPAFLAKGENDFTPEEIHDRLMAVSRELFAKQGAAADQAKAAEIMTQLRRAQIAAGIGVNVQGALEEFDATERANNAAKEIEKLKLTEQERADLILANRRTLAAEISKIDKDVAAADAARDKATFQQRYQATYKMFGDIAEASKVFGRKGLAVYRAAAHAQNIMDTYAGATAAYKSLAGIPYVGPVLGAAAAAAAIAAGIARASIIQSQQPGFAAGGYTGAGGRYEVAGVVHRGEFVVPAPEVQRIGVGNLQALADGRGGDVSVGGASVNVAMINTRSDYRRFLETDPGAEKWVIDVVSKNKFKLGIT